MYLGPVMYLSFMPDNRRMKLPKCVVGK